MYALDTADYYCSRLYSTVPRDVCTLSYCLPGDSYRYTLQPVFNDVRSSFRCHVTRRVPKALYRLWFYVTVPGGRLETERIYVDVRPKDGATVDSGRYSFDEFLTIEFDTRQRFDRDLIVTGKQTIPDADGSGSSDQRWIHTINGVTVDGDEDRHDSAAAAAAVERGPVHRLSDNVYVTSVVFDEPFAYSTSNWVKG
jgi:hypothetical protein